MTDKLRDSRPIGIFDSGLGGLTAVTALAEALPEERFVYFGDTARTPYGSKAVETIQRFSVQIAEFLLKHDAKLIVIACNTISATALELLRRRFPGTPFIGIIEPAARFAAGELGAERRLGIIATKVTIESRQYEEMIRRFGGRCSVFSKACPLFVPAIEEGMADTALMDEIVRYYLDDFVRDNALDALILGCTHYPLVEKSIRRLYPTLEIIDPSRIVAREVERVLDELSLRGSGELQNRFYASDLSECFLRMIHSIVGGSDVVVRQKNFEEEPD
ncbi:MAG: glutamate racemase [Ruminococcaceae bacterium]|nr:glutamate racemase [Oscillospiraceae bacterium]